jgi:hypothetical protein
LRYSEKPIDAYGLQGDGAHQGPATLDLLKCDLEAWNLAYLSFDFEATPGIPPPEFMHLLARTLRMDLQTGTVHGPGTRLMREVTIRPLLERGPRAFANQLLAHPRVRQMPLYQGFGERWLTLVFERACIAREVPPAEMPQSGPELNAVEQARRILDFLIAERP